MPFAKGNKLSGSRKGRPNKVTADLRAMIESALMAAGGQEYLQKQAEENPQAFMGLVGKCLPKDIRLGGSLKLEVNLIGVRRESDG